MSGTTKNFFATNLLQLQNFIKRDASSYRDEFLQTYHNFESTLQVFLTKPSKPSKELADLLLFLAHVSNCFPDELKTYPQQLIDVLKKYSTVLDPEMRLTLCRCLMLIRSKNLIEPIALFEVFFSLLKCPDKGLRKTLYTHMAGDARKIKTKQKNHKLCGQLQQYVFKLATDPHPLIAKYAINLMIELYRKQVWNDPKTVNIIANGCLSKQTKVLAVSLNFFSGKETNEDDNNNDSESESEKQTAAQVLLALRVGKKTNKRQKRTDRALKTIRAEKKNKKKKEKNQLSNFTALNLIYDPQDFAEKLFKKAETTNESFELKIAMLDLVARTIGVHQLFVNNFHTFLLRFLNPHQREVAKMLWFISISSHELTPPDVPKFPSFLLFIQS
jgi:protein SDA1